MEISITLTGQDLIELIEQKVSQEVSKHGHPGSFEVEIQAVHMELEASPLKESNLKDYEVRAFAKPKAPQAPK